LFCYFHLARTYSHLTLLPLPLGGIFYSVGAALNLARWPVIVPGVFAAHEIFHFFVIAGSASHIFFMLNLVVPCQAPSVCLMPAADRSTSFPRAMHGLHPPQWNSPPPSCRRDPEYAALD
jgi:hypothetical protein